MFWFDWESLGLSGPGETLTWAEDDGEIRTHHVWLSPMRDTLKLIERACDNESVGGFNLTFDWWHNQRTYSVGRLMPPGEVPSPRLWKSLERGSWNGPCVKPRSALDLMLFARRGPAQSLMERDDIRIRSVPDALAPLLAEELQARIQLDAVYFARKKNGYTWSVVPCEKQPGFSDVVLYWGAKAGLKALLRHLHGIDAEDLPMPDELMDKSQRDFDPFTWDEGLLVKQVNYWVTNEAAQRYMRLDVDGLRILHRGFGRPGHGDYDSVLACSVGSCRWHGWPVDVSLLAQIQEEAERSRDASPRSPGLVLAGLHERLSPIARLAVTDTRTKPTLETLATHKDWEGTPVAEYAARVIKARSAEKEVDLCVKLRYLERAFFDFKIIGALSGRMSGAGGYNAQGIPKTLMRAAFLLADPGWVLDGGDFVGSQVAIAAAVYNDPALTTALTAGKKPAAILAEKAYKAIYDATGDEEYDKDYAYFREEENDREYKVWKNVLFADMFGAEIPKQAATAGLPEDLMAIGMAGYREGFPGVGAARLRVAERFCSMRQAGGIGSKVEWHVPADYVDSIGGLRRYFTLENKLCEALFNLARKPPKEFHKIKLRVQRKPGRIQTVGGAVQTALYGCAFGIQARNMRAAANHEIQAPEARIIKEIQRAIWDHQPAGIHEWVVIPFTVHDEVEVARAPHIDLNPTVQTVIERFKPQIPLLRMDWATGLKNWAEKDKK